MNKHICKIGFRVSGFGFREGSPATGLLCLHLNPERRILNPETRRAFTLAELIIGLLLLAIIGGASAGVASAISRGWQMGEANHTSNLTITRTMLRIQDKVQRAKVMGEWRAGSVDAPETGPGAAVLFWRDDANGDDMMQLDETQLLEYDPGTKQLIVHEVAFPDPITRAANNGPFSSTILSEPNAIEDYKKLTYRTDYAMTRGVLGVAFNLKRPSSPSQQLQFEFQLRFNGPSGETFEYGTGSPRAPHK